MKRFNVCVKRSYTTKTGEEKTSWPRIGVAFEGDKGISGIIEMIPTGSWDGRFVLFAADDEQRAPTSQPKAASGSQPAPEFDDGIPF